MQEWHKGGYTLGQERFQILHKRLTEAKYNKNEEEIERTKQGIQYLGLYSLPAVVTHVVENGPDEGASQALSYWSEHWTGHNLDVAQMTREELKRWWLDNKEKLLIPGAGDPMLDDVLGIAEPKDCDPDTQSQTKEETSGDSSTD
jgi:hypothetical protein